MLMIAFLTSAFIAMSEALAELFPHTTFNQRLRIVSHLFFAIGALYMTYRVGAL